MSLDFSYWLRDDAHAHARHRLCERHHRAGEPRALADVRRRSARGLFVRAWFPKPGAVALVADVVMVSVAAAVALVAAQSLAP